MAETAAKAHALILRVMRLARPKFYEGPTMGIDDDDEYAPMINEAVCNSTGQLSMEFPYSTHLLAPQTIDNIYLGETFTFYVSVLNDSNEVCKNVIVSVAIQTQSQKIALNSNFMDGTAAVQPKDFIGQVISHEVKEAGQHILVCEVSYTMANGESMNLRKFFKFPVEKPIDVKTKFFSAEDNMSSDVYLEAQIQNLSNGPIVLEVVDLQPSPYYQKVDCGLPIIDPKEGIHLNTQDIYQFLFCLTPAAVDSAAAQFRGVSTIGKLDISWRRSMGEPGRLQTSQLSRMVPTYGDIRLIVEKIPGNVNLHNLFGVDCRVVNCSERSLDLVMTMDNETKRPFLFACPSGVQLGQVLPNSSAVFHLDILPLERGIQPLSGIRLTDSFLKRTYEMNDVAQILVS